MTMMVQHELVDLERDFWQAIVDRDLDFCRRHVTEDVLVVFPQGMADREGLMRMLGDMAGRMTGYELGEPLVRELTEDSVLVAYEGQTTGEYQGQQMTMDLYASTVWVQRHGQWLAAFHQETQVQPNAAQ